MTTTTNITTAKTPLAPPSPPPLPPAPGPFRFPDPPERELDEMTSFRQLHKTGHSHHLSQHLGNEDTTLVGADLWIALAPRSGTRGLRRPDLLIAFDVDPAAYDATGGYLISEQGKPPDFVLEVASVSTARVDVEQKPIDYAALGILEYWRFDETGAFHGKRLAGDRLVNGKYVPIPIEELPDGSLQGYSPALNLYLRAEHGQLGWYDPETGRHIATFNDERAGRLRAEARADQAEARADEEHEARLQEREARTQAEARSEQEREARLQEREARVQAEARTQQAEAQVREMREELRRLRGG